MFAFLLFLPYTTNKTKCICGHNAGGKLNIELIRDRKLSRRLTCDPETPFGRCLSGRGKFNRRGDQKQSKSQPVRDDVFNNKHNQHHRFSLLPEQRLRFLKAEGNAHFRGLKSVISVWYAAVRRRSLCELLNSHP